MPTIARTFFPRQGLYRRSRETTNRVDSGFCRYQGGFPSNLWPAWSPLFKWNLRFRKSHQRTFVNLDLGQTQAKPSWFIQNWGEGNLHNRLHLQWRIIIKWNWNLSYSALSNSFYSFHRNHFFRWKDICGTVVGPLWDLYGTFMRSFYWKSKRFWEDLKISWKIKANAIK